ncbi:helix-turn-helix domain-containing protein [Paenibacillus alvei]|uniref:Helix-turn-helix domain-containing protein n=1 Tax=Paenibacillus alvei TaxID=44250 RepID=A0ABT4E6U5_PAEAL|nr:helix-turn-helix transcriptional regulator [Paenibacillus alvei]MCY9529330.1 helix-turn-helix domain-containing protein [Paenibacillus alvei]
MNNTYQGELKKLGGRIRYLREQREFSQELLSFKADIHRTYLSQLELGQRNPSYTTLLKLSSALSINITELIKIDKTT